MQDLRDRDEARDRAGGGGDGDDPDKTRVKLVTDDIPQAFSHFSLYYSQRPTSSIKGKDGVAVHLYSALVNVAAKQRGGANFALAAQLVERILRPNSKLYTL